ncbi:hypothetical protein [Sutcliffiella sp. FSL R7-0096]
MIPLVYDQINRWGKDDEFFLALLKKLNVKKLQIWAVEQED